MAITNNLTDSQFGISFNNAYYRIVTAAVQRMRNEEGMPKFTVMIDIAGYAAEPTNDDTRDIDFKRYHADLAEVEAQEGVDFLSKCYNWAMNHPELAGSTKA